MVSDVKYHFLFVWQYVTYITNFNFFYILLNSLNNKSKICYFIFRTDFCVR